MSRNINALVDVLKSRAEQFAGSDLNDQEVVDTDHAFDPPLSNDELLAIYDYGKGW